MRDPRALIEAACTAGFGTLWLATSTPQWVDPTTVAGALAARASELLVGSVVSIAAGRHPSVVAREVTTIDVISGGRAALRIASGTVPPPALAESALICRSLFRSPRTTFSGAVYRVEDAPNRPPPVRPGGPPLLVDVGGAGLTGAALPEDLHLRGTDVDAVVVDGPPGGPGTPMTAWVAYRPEGPGVLWRGPAETDPAVVARMVRTAVAGGASGAIVRAPQAAHTGGIDWVQAIGRALAGAAHA